MRNYWYSSQISLINKSCQRFPGGRDSVRLIEIGLLGIMLTLAIFDITWAADLKTDPFKNLIVTDLTVSRPAISGKRRFVTGNCTVKNVGTQRITPKVLAMFLVDENGKEEIFRFAPQYDPPGGVPTVRKRWESLINGILPGKSFAFRRFGKIQKNSETYSCVVKAQNEKDQWYPLAFADGHPASVSLRTISERLAPTVTYEVKELNSNHVDPHVYPSGETIKLKLLPMLSGGPDARSLVSSLKITPGAKPFRMTDTNKAKDLILGDGSAQMEWEGRSQQGFFADFWKVAENKRYLDIEVEFSKAIELQSLSLIGLHHNRFYGFMDPALSVVNSEGSVTKIQVIPIQEGDNWKIIAKLDESVSARSLRLRVGTPYKICIRSLIINMNSEALFKNSKKTISTAQWKDGFGKPLSQPKSLKLFQENTIVSPPDLDPGYYGLDITTRIPGMDEKIREYGFVVVPSVKSVPTGKPNDVVKTNPRFGMVHASLKDANLGFSEIKTLTASSYDAKNEKLDAASWHNAIEYRRQRGFTELPLSVGDPWSSDPTHPIGEDQLHRLRRKMKQYFEVTPELHWELGIEENLSWRANRGTWTHYWANLAAKAKVVREAADQTDAHIKLIYQIAEIDPHCVDEFLSSEAAEYFDILSLHPYPWPDFPPPENWMPKYLSTVYTLMEKYKQKKPVWFTEYGSAQDNTPGKDFFGYEHIYNRGVSRSENMAFVVRSHLVAFRSGVEKIFWYNYKDRGSNPQYPEDNFGLVDHWGYPKPGYAAYATMTRVLRNKILKEPTAHNNNTDTDIQVFHFSGTNQNCLVVWTYPAKEKEISLDRLGITSTNVAQVLNVDGKPVSLRENTITISGYPVYLIVDK
ncbi:hypothetical protein [uncultured Ilyobacter sp.]|uniref:hypothetical protein n=1 Tax=uncultured Ilyobacter sp. TaxID=544433 RepID=UPI0029F4942F|nr:hypothetical protein [uncultured Ilyobacter sp.]